MKRPRRKGTSQAQPLGVPGRAEAARRSRRHPRGTPGLSAGLPLGKVGGRAPAGCYQRRADAAD
jgi:hypothetical protein